MIASKATNEPLVVLPVVYANPKDELDAAPRVKIRVHKTGDKNEQKQVYVGVNGIGYLIQRGQDVDVPEPVMRVLENAVQSVWDYDEHTQQRIKRDALAYPFTRLS